MIRELNTWGIPLTTGFTAWFVPHWFQVAIEMKNLEPLGIPDEFKRMVLTSPKFVIFEKTFTQANIAHGRIFALSARDAHYQLSIQMEALGWIEGSNWRVTMICPEAEK